MTQPGGANNTLNQVVLQAPGVSQDAESAGGIHVRNEMQPEEFRINGIPLPTGLSYFGQGLSPRFANSFNPTFPYTVMKMFTISATSA